MKKRIFICMYSLNIGGAERSLIGLLDSFDYEKYDVDLFLYRHEGEFMKLIPKKVHLLPAIKPYTTFERPIKDVLKEGHLYLGGARVLAKLKATIKNRGLEKEQGTYKQMQYMWKYSIPRLPKITNKYDAALSFLGPHNFVLDKITADIKLGWNHTDYFSIVNPDKPLDEKMWSGLEYIVNVSEDCEKSFLKVFPKLRNKTIVLENILSPNFVRVQSNEAVKDLLDEKVFTVCSVGRYSYQKGFDLAIKACAELIKQGYNMKWYTIGYGTEEKELLHLIKENNLENHFILLGKKENPYPYMKRCDLYCQPSRYEGKAVTVREAQILGKPVLITDFLTAKSQLKDQFDGYVCDLSVEGIIDGIKIFYHNPELSEQLSNNCLSSSYGNEGEMKKLYRLINGSLNKEFNNNEFKDKYNRSSI
jgi:glycosyltransferase involved in cell wall biosynthesis